MEEDITKEQEKNLLAAAEDLFGYSPCLHCKHLRDDEPEDEKSTCDAFPEGIPEEIFFGENLHKEPYPGDNGITFEEIEE